MPSTIEGILPHRNPMLMISKVVSKSIEAIHCQAYIDQENPFLSHGTLPAYVGLELIAQASGLYLGLAEQGLGQQSDDFGAPRLGAIVAVRDLVMADVAVQPGVTLDITAEFWGGSQQAAQFSGQVLLGQEEVCRTRVTIAILEEGK